MKSLVYIIVGLLVVIWGIIYFGIDDSSAVHLILGLAIVLGLGNYLFYKTAKRKLNKKVL